MTRRVLTTGCFDPCHPGHVAQLVEARELGDYLIVALTTDEAMTREKRAPFFPWNERAMVLKQLRCVSQVIANHGVAADLLRYVGPDIYAKGIEYKGRLPEERLCKSLGIKVAFIDSHPVYSSTALLTGRALRDRIAASRAA